MKRCPTSCGFTLVEMTIALGVAAIVMLLVGQGVRSMLGSSAERTALATATSDVEAELARIRQDHRYRVGNPIIAGGELQIQRARRAGGSVTNGVVRRRIVCRTDQYHVGTLAGFPASCPHQCPLGQVPAIEVIDEAGSRRLLPTLQTASHGGAAAMAVCFALTPAALTVTAEAAVLGSDGATRRISREIALTLGRIQGGEVEVVP